MRTAIVYALLFAVITAVCLTLHGCAMSVPLAAGIGAGGALGGVALLTYVESTPITQELLTYAGREAVIKGLQQLPGADQHAAAQIVVDASQDALKYLTGDASGALADVINQIIGQKFKAVHPVILGEIMVAAWWLGKVVPSSNTYLSGPQLADLVAFVNGLQSGAQTFLVNSAVEVQTKYTKRRDTVKVGDSLPVYPNWFSTQ